MELSELTIKQLKDRLEQKEISPVEIVESYFQRINDQDDKIKAYLTLTGEEARQRAEKVEQHQGALAGIPLAIKDNISTAGIRTTCASRMLENYLPPYDAAVIKKLKESGSIILGKTNMDEFAMGSSTEHSAFFPTRNPLDLARVPGGSSGGSAAAVAAGMTAAALGSDTGGSIRQPAAFCGVVGLKPTYGLVSRNGLIAYASSLDQIGPITRDVTDAALLLNQIAGHDPFDSTSVPEEVPDYTSFLKSDVKGIKIGIPEEYFAVDINQEVKEAVLETVKKLEQAGAVIEEVNLLDAEYALAAYYIIAPAEASSNLARYDGVRYGLRSNQPDNIREMFTTTRSEGFGQEVKRRIMLGTYALSSGYYDDFYRRAQQVRTLIKDDFVRVFKEFDLLLSPTTPTTAFQLGQVNDPLEMYQADIFTVPVNIAGIPAISVPCGFDSSQLPIGLQLMGPHFGEGKLLKAAYSIEQLLALENKRGVSHANQV